MNSFATPNAAHHLTPSINNATTAPSSTFQSAELANLLNIIMKLWKEQPNHFGFEKFDEFLKKLPEYYYALIQQYQQQILRLQQKQQQQQQQQQQQLQMQQQSTQQDVLKCQNNNNIKQQLQVPQPVKEQKSQPTIECNKSTQPQQDQNEQQQEQQQSKSKSIQTKRGYKVRASRKPRLEAIEEERPLTPSLSSNSPIPSPSVSPSPPSYDRLNAFAPEFVPNDDSSPSSSPQPISESIESPSIESPAVSYTKLHPFVPKHAARAKLNIYIPKHMTKGLLAMISESFPNTNTLYYYLDISTALQINDKQMEVMLTKSGDKIVIVHFDLHKKETNEILYAVVTPNDQHKIEANTQKWLWKLDGFYTQNEICDKYDILPSDFPKSSRLMKNGIYQKFAEQYNEINYIPHDIVNLLKDYKWESNEIKIIGSSQKSKKGKKAPELKLNFTRDEWINQVLSSWNNNYPLIPIVVYENRDINKHWIEWVKLIYIQQSQSFIGITFKYNDNNKWQIESICLDKGDIHNKHRLIGLQNIESRHNINYDQYFDNFNTKITEIQWR